jgi:hypothetical protein
VQLPGHLEYKPTPVSYRAAVLRLRNAEPDKAGSSKAGFLTRATSAQPRHPTSCALVLLAQYTVRLLSDVSRLNNEDNYTQTAMEWIQEQLLYGKTYNLRVFNARHSPSNSKLL